MKTLYMMIGIPGSGKSTIARRLAKDYQAQIISSDYVRKVNPNWAEEMIFPEVYRLIQENIKNTNVIFDATNIDRLTRSKHLGEIRKAKIDFHLSACLVISDVEVCKKRIELRNKLSDELYLPVEVVETYAHKFIFPQKDEGYRDILIFDNN